MQTNNYKLGPNIKLFAGNSNPEIAQEIAQILGTELAKAYVRRFSDGEIAVDLGETVRGCDVFLIQSTCPPVNDNLMEMLLMMDAFKRASAGRIFAVIPYYGYARQDRKARPREPIAAKLVADHDYHCGRVPRPDHGPARQADPGLLRYPGGSSHGRSRSGRTLP